MATSLGRWTGEKGKMVEQQPDNDDICGDRCRNYRKKRHGPMNLGVFAKLAIWRLEGGVGKLTQLRGAIAAPAKLHDGQINPHFWTTYEL